MNHPGRFRRAGAARARTLLFFVPWLLCSCSKPDPHHEQEHQADPEHRDEQEHPELPERVRLSAQVIRDAKIRTEVAGKKPLLKTISLPGEVSTDPDRTAEVSAPVPGRLSEVKFKEGSVVKKGDTLAVLHSPELGQVRAALADSRVKAKAATAKAERLRKLRKDQLVTEQELLDAEAESEASRLKAESFSAQLSASNSHGGTKVVLRAPLSGVVLRHNAVVGQPVMANGSLATIADLSEVWFLGRVFEKDLGRLQRDAPAVVELNAYPNKRFVGKLAYLGKSVDPVARTLTARILLTNDGDALRVGLFGLARVSVESEAKARRVLAVPRSAVTEIDGKRVVFVRQPDGHFERHDVTLGESGVGNVEVVSGLRAGEHVVVEGVFAVKSALLRDTFGEGEH